MFFRKLIAFIKKDFFIQISYRFSFILTGIGIIIPVLTFYFIAKLFGKGLNPYLKEYGGEYFPFVLIGLALSSYLGMALRTFSLHLREEQMMGTLEAMFLTPTKVSNLMIFMPCWDFIFNSLNALICLLLGVYFLGVKLVNTSFWAVFIILILTISCSIGIGIISAAFIMVFKKGDPITWSINLFSGFFGGIYFPIAILPPRLQFISYLMPLTYALRALRHALLQGYGFVILLPDIIILLLFTLVLLPLSIFLFKFALKRTKINGSLGHY